MNSTRELRHQILDSSLSTDERARLRCRLAKHLEEIGQYEAAQEAMDDLWPTFNDRPNLEGLKQDTAAEVLLRVGALIGWIGSFRQIEGAQEIAKDRISESISIFESFHAGKKVAEAQTEMALFYEREGELENARARFADALSQLDDHDGDLKAVALLRSAVLEELASRWNDALYLLRSASPLFEASINQTLKGRFHNEFALVLRNLSAIEKRPEYIDRALIEYAAASFHFEQAGNDRYQACVENNLGFLFGTLRRFPEAHEHLDRAQSLFTRLGDNVHLAQVAETRARVLLDEGAIVQAEKSARWAVELLENGDECPLLAEVLTTYGIALCRLQHQEQARVTLERAIEIAERVGALESAGLAGLTLVEQLPECLSDDEFYSILERADDRLENTQNAELLRRQKNCFRRFAFRVLWPNWPSSLEDSIHRHEARQIRRALEESGGVIKRAASLLELTRQGLGKILNKRQPELLKTINEIKFRSRTGENVRAAWERDRVNEVNTLRVLHVEDDKTVAGVVKEMLENQGWHVETCADGNAALEIISGEEDYDLLLVDYDLPGVNGIELVNRARELDHRCDMPMVVLAASPVEAAAREAGADVFLQKPEDVSSLVDTINHLLEEREQEH
jgi:CheY-like chemotaxis protein